MQETMQTIQQALDALLKEGWTLFRGTIQGQEGAHTFNFMKRHMPYHGIRRRCASSNNSIQSALTIFKRTIVSCSLCNALPHPPHGIAKLCAPCTDSLQGARRMPETMRAKATIAPGLRHQRRDVTLPTKL